MRVGVWEDSTRTAIRRACYGKFGTKLRNRWRSTKGRVLIAKLPFVQKNATSCRRLPANGVRASTLIFQRLREDLKDSAFVTQFLGYHSQRLRHHPYSPLGAPNQWNGVVASSYPTNAGCSCQSRSATSARSFRREQTLLREMGNARTKSRTRNLYDGLRSYSKRRRTTHRKRHVMVGPR